jgi:cytochrome c oxidase subunit 5a
VTPTNHATIEQRNLNNAFAYDLVPSPTVIAAALKAARRVNDFPTAVRVFEGKRPHRSSTNTAKHGVRRMPQEDRILLTSQTGIKAKVENKGQYQQYLDELKPLREELGITLKEDLYPEAADKINN